MFYILIIVLVLGYIFYTKKSKQNGPIFTDKFKNSHLTFHKEIYATSGILMFTAFWVISFNKLINFFPNLTLLGNASSTWFIELWVLAYVLIILLVSYLIKSWFNTSLAITGLGLFISAEIWKFVFDRFTINPESEYITPLSAFGLTWILINFTYVVGKYLAAGKYLKRVGNTLRFLAITSNVIFLAGLSNSYLISFALQFLLTGSSILNSWPLILIALSFIALLAIVLFVERKSGLSPLELFLSFIPGFIMVIASIFPYNFSSIPTQSYNFTNNLYMVIWAVVFNVLYLSYLFYLLYKSNKTKEAWLKIYTIILIILALFERIIDIGSNLSFNGIFLTIFGSLVLLSIGLIQYLRKRNGNNK